MYSYGPPYLLFLSLALVLYSNPLFVVHRPQQPKETTQKLHLPYQSASKKVGSGTKTCARAGRHSRTGARTKTNSPWNPSIRSDKDNALCVYY